MVEGYVYFITKTAGVLAWKYNVVMFSNRQNLFTTSGLMKLFDFCVIFSMFTNTNGSSASVVSSKSVASNCSVLPSPRLAANSVVTAVLYLCILCLNALGVVKETTQHAGDQIITEFYAYLCRNTAD